MSPKSASNGCASDNHEQSSTADSPPAQNTTSKTSNQPTNQQGMNANNDKTNQFDGGDQNNKRSDSSGTADLSDTNHPKLCGLFHIGTVNRDPYRKPPSELADTYLMCRAFWCDHGLLTDNLVGNVMNVLDLFTVTCDEEFLKNTKQRHMLVEQWEKISNEPEKLISIAKLPLHQFHIAFHEKQLMQHVMKQKMPVVSLDGWSTFMPPGIETQAGTIQVVLAIGTEEQIAYLRHSKNILRCRSFLREPQRYLPIVSRAAFPQHFLSIDKPLSAPVSQTIPPPLPSTVPAPADAVTRKAQLAARLNSFIENLASELPEKVSKVNQTSGTGVGIAELMNLKSTIAKPDNTAIPPPGKNIRATADLLDELQRALTSASAQRRNITAPAAGDDDGDRDDRFGVIIDIDCAMNLPKQIIKLNKKHSKRRDNNLHVHGCDGRQRENTINEIEPSSYVTFEATGPTINMVNTVDGPVYTTNVVLKNCNPQWNKRFDVYLPVDMLFNNKRKFQIKIWRKVANDILQARLIPNPSDDAIIGCVSLDLVDLLNEQHSITGCFNILNASEQVTGQIKITIEPKDDLQIYRDKRQTNIENREPSESAPSADQNFVNEINDALTDRQGQFSLNRMLKRKFTELEEITERLRARLLDVTDETDDLDKDMDDEFESDLNTLPDEDCDDWSFVDENESLPGTSQNNLQFIAQSLASSELNETATVADNNAKIAVSESPESAAP